MKMKKLNLSSLKVESFVTSLEENNANTLKGGTSTPECAVMLSIASVATVVSVSVIVVSVITRDDLSATGTTPEGPVQKSQCCSALGNGCPNSAHIGCSYGEGC